MHTLNIFLLTAIFSVGFCHARAHLPHRKFHCFSEKELSESRDRLAENFLSHKMDWDKYTPVKLAQDLKEIEGRRRRRKRASENGCPNLQTIINGSTVNERSISPWVYRINDDATRYPRLLAFAHCQCEHCINVETGAQSASLNSVPVYQKMMVLRKTVCPHDRSLYAFTKESLEVPVACTCALPRYG